MRGQYSTGGSPNLTRPRRLEEDEWEKLLAEKKIPAGGRGTPLNIIRRPIDLPPMERIQQGDE